MKHDKKSESFTTTYDNIKISIDPVTSYPTVHLHNIDVVLEKGTTVQDLQDKPLSEIKECAL